MSTPFADFVRAERERAAEVDASLAEIARAGVPILVTGRRYGQHASADALVSPDPSRPGAWRVTWFADGVPNGDGHLEAPTLLAGLRLAHRPDCVLTPVTAETAPLPVQHPRLTDRDHPADDPTQIEAMRLAIGVRDMVVARSIARDVLARREQWERAQHPDGSGACDPETACEECARAYGREDMAEGAEKAREDEAA
jgi:hypothetical protein